MNPAPEADAARTDVQGRLSLVPFRGLRFASAKVGDPAAVISPPYDMIDPIQAHRLARSGAHNIVRLILPELNEPDARLRYRRAARTLREWREENALVLDSQSALYVYEQTGPSGNQRGLIGALKLPADDSGPVLPHEDVVDVVVADRQALMHAIGANPEPILLTYEGGGPASDLVERYAEGPDPIVDAATADGTHHRLWPITDPAQHAIIAADLAPRRSLIADGHHRYAAYQRLAALGRPGTDRGLALLVDSKRHPLQVRGIHRWIPDLSVAPALEAAAEHFTVTEVPGGYKAVLAALARIGPERIAVAAVDRQRAWLIADPKPQLLAETIPPDRPESWRRLDATVLHLALAQKVWGVPDTAERIRFDHDARNAVIEAQQHHGLAVLLRPVAESTVLDLAAAGIRMPRKSTAFAPKPATGLVLRLLDEI
ncbi:DUF1015 domain-containing protein [Actinocrinis sp.]|uniref:DUF1015 domain-containing protein n=1 Tax=Actinocrinis sp. TaxID=1920516 RepID=UPI002B699763|nr:DUF1015 domain-containing protein [Actinocrinis sp.]HXR69636.1 DUF1015 domain-containing protein [Actinocrinis sp.]